MRAGVVVLAAFAIGMSISSPASQRDDRSGRRILATGATSHFLVTLLAEGTERWIQLTLPDPSSTEAYREGGRCRFALEEWSVEPPGSKQVPTGVARGTLSGCTGRGGPELLGEAKKITVMFLPLGPRRRKGWVKLEREGQPPASYTLTHARIPRRGEAK